MAWISRSVLCLLGLSPPLTAQVSPPPSLMVGQEWRFRARPGDPSPSLVIVRIESHPKLGEIVHISVRGVHLRNSGVPSGFSSEISHMPFARSALEASLVALLKPRVSLPSFDEGYDQWLMAKGGVFTVSVAEAIDLMETALNQ